MVVSHNASGSTSVNREVHRGQHGDKYCQRLARSDSDPKPDVTPAVSEDVKKTIQNRAATWLFAQLQPSPAAQALVEDMAVEGCHIGARRSGPCGRRDPAAMALSRRSGRGPRGPRPAGAARDCRFQLSHHQRMAVGEPGCLPTSMLACAVRLPTRSMTGPLWSASSTTSLTHSVSPSL